MLANITPLLHHSITPSLHHSITPLCFDMSRIGKQPIVIPPKVKVEVKGQQVFVEGPKGKLNWELPRRTSLKVDNGKVLVNRQGDDAQARGRQGLSRGLVNNMVRGVSEGFSKKLEMQGVGFKATVHGK